MGHLPPWRLTAATLDPAEEQHVLGCVRCRAERRVLLNTESAPSTSTDGAPFAVSGGYALEHVIGRGRFSVVYAARRTLDGQWVAIKVLAADAEGLRARLERFRDRRHPGLVPVDALLTNGDDGLGAEGLGVVARLVHGSSVAALLLVHAPSARAVAALLAQLLDALGALHAAGLAHGSVRATNVLLELELAGDGVRAQLVDGGIVAGTAREDLDELGRLAELLGERCAEGPPAWLGAFVAACAGAESAADVERPSAGEDPLADVARVCRDLRDRWDGFSVAGGNRYRRHVPIGRGAHGIVYRAWDSTYGCEVAVKMRPPSAADSGFADEFRRMEGLYHPNLATVYDVVETPQATFIVMELVPGARLDPTTDGAHLGSIAVQLFDGLAALHEGGLFHRDVKLANLLLEPGGRLAIVDFGLARPLPYRHLSLAGTRYSRAPEILAAAQAPTPKVDIYAAGIALFELARGHRWEEDEPPSEERITQGCSDPVLAELIRDCVRRDPGDRPTASAARARLPTPPTAPVVLPRLDGAFVGRIDEVARIRAALVPGRVLRLTGPPGIGKTRLVREALGRAALVGRCGPNETVAFNAFDEPFTAEGVSRAVQDGADPATTVLARRFLDRWRASGLPLWLDDVQWMDADSVAVLRAILRHEDHPPLIVTHRPLEAGDPVDEILAARAGPAEIVGPLPASAVELMRRELRLTASEEAIDRCGGNPLLLTRLALRGPDHEADPIGRLPLRPEDRLAAAELLRVVALHGGAVPTAVLSSVIRSERFAQVFIALTRARILAYVTTLSVDYVHDSERDVVLSALPRAERGERHAALAEGFSWPAQRDPGAVARHWAAAGHVDRARAPALEAAEIAEGAGAWARAATFYALLLDAGERPAAALARRMATAFANAGYNERAGRLLADVGEPADWTRAAELLCAAANREEADRALDHALAHLGLARARSPTLDVLIGIVTSLWIDLRPPALAGRRGERAERAADLLWVLTGSLGQYDPVRTFRYAPLHLRRSFQSGDPGRAARALATHLVYLDGVGAGPARLAELDRRVDELARGVAPEVVGWIDASRGYRKLLRGELRAAFDHLDASDALYKRLGVRRWEWTAARTHRLFTLVLLGRHSEAIPVYDELIAQYRELGDRATEAFVEAGAGVPLALVQDAPDEAAARLARSLAPLSDPPFSFRSLQLGSAVQLHLYRGEPERARAALAAARSTMPLTRLFQAPRTLLWLLDGMASEPGDSRVRRRRVRSLRAVPLPVGPMRAESVALLDAHRGGGELRAVAQRCFEVATQVGGADHADAAALVLEPVEDVLERVRRRGVRAPARWLALFGAVLPGEGVVEEHHRVSGR